MARKLATKAMTRKRRAGARRASASGTSRPLRQNVESLINTRELFWNNVIREILTALSSLGVMRRQGEGEGGAPAGDAGQPPPDPLDGRLAVIVQSGERIPIAEVYPLFACGIPGTPAERELSMAVECTVFQIRTPAGEVYTLPLHEVRGFHALSEELMTQLEEAAGVSSAKGGEPFGFAAFTSLSRSQGANQPAPLPNDVAD